MLGTAEGVASLWTEGLDALDALAGTVPAATLTRTRSLALRWLDGRVELLAGALAAAHGWTVLSTDLTRDRLLPGRRGSGSTVDAGRYEPRSVAAVYDAVLSEAEVVLRAGGSVVLDASFGSTATRAAVHALATRVAADVHELHCRVDDDVAEQRIRTRPPGASEATAEVRVRLAQREDPWPGATVIDTGLPIAAGLATAERVVCPAGHHRGLVAAPGAPECLAAPDRPAGRRATTSSPGST